MLIIRVYQTFSLLTYTLSLFLTPIHYGFLLKILFIQHVIFMFQNLRFPPTLLQSISLLKLDTTSNVFIPRNVYLKDIIHPLLLTKYRLWNQNYNKELKMLKLLVINSLISSFSSKPCSLYSHLSYLKRSSSLPCILKHEDKTTSDSLGKAILFNNYFNSVFTRSDFILPPMHCLPIPSSKLSFLLVKMFDVLNSLDPTKSPGHANISPYIYKFCASSLAHTVSLLFTVIMESHSIPADWKVHKLFPLHKNGSVSEVSNYRPISLLSILHEVLELIVYSKIIDFIYPKISKTQFGFRSTLQQPLLSYTSVFNSVESKRHTEIVFLDFAKAFDSIPHNELLYKLGLTGLTGPLWLFFKDYLQNRKHFVEVEGCKSDLLPVQSGVPQGSVLGLCFFLFMLTICCLSALFRLCFYLLMMPNLLPL